MVLEDVLMNRQKHSAVPCNGCTACCKHDRVYLGPKDDPKYFRWHNEDGYAVLDRKDNGDCVYLTEAGCGIHDKAPEICKRMDCRVLYLMTTAGKRASRIAENTAMAAVYQAGFTRLNTLET